MKTFLCGLAALCLSVGVTSQAMAQEYTFTTIEPPEASGSSAAGINGKQVTVLREGDKQIPIVTRLRMEERAQLADVQNLYVYASQGTQKAPLSQVSSVTYGMQTEKIRRRNQFRTITVSCLAEAGHLPSEIVGAARLRLPVGRGQKRAHNSKRACAG